MKKVLSILSIAALFLVVIVTQAFAFAPNSLAKPQKTPHPAETETLEAGSDSSTHKPEKANPHAGKKYNFKGEVTAFSGSVLQITLKDGSSVSVNVDAGTQIKFAGKKDASSSTTIQPQDTVVVQAVKAEDQTYRAVRIHVLPAKPEHVHRVGTVTAYTPGVSITIESTPGKDDQDEADAQPASAGTTTFQISPDVKILPAKRADQLQVGARVTIISPHAASGETPVATGIVVHPAASDSDDD